MPLFSLYFDGYCVPPRPGQHGHVPAAFTWNTSIFYLAEKETLPFLLLMKVLDEQRHFALDSDRSGFGKSDVVVFISVSHCHRSKNSRLLYTRELISFQMRQSSRMRSPGRWLAENSLEEKLETRKRRKRDSHSSERENKYQKRHHHRTREGHCLEPRTQNEWAEPNDREAGDADRACKRSGRDRDWHHYSKSSGNSRAQAAAPSP
ncbi:hypothetical protein ANANG_G00073030 [Anguilla anguilla]|uniref:Uncharacterized protein n=1 Tax=Anguilla anguilla TaxID=7936 RepID=A0A9D3MST8_ANGAN|nr:hypothetical protein ANANG_G00073030 [Anguilla anguilla]